MKDAMTKARETAGWREKYAMKNGNKNVKYVNGRVLYVWTYSKHREYQDANGATFDATNGRWVG